MQSQNNDEKKLDWMYKGPTSMVDREEYLLGRSIDKTLEQINAEEKEKSRGLLAPPKNHVEHECIPPSIRDYNKIVQAEQVDLSAKLQEDPLVAIKKREEEARRQFLQNPVQLKKLQKALKAQEDKKNKKKHKKSKHSTDSDNDSDLDSRLSKKLKLLKGNPSAAGLVKKQKKGKHNALDTILMHKFNQLKDKLSEEDLKSIIDGTVSASDEDSTKRKKNRKRSSSSSSEDKSKISEKRKPRRNDGSDDERRRNYKQREGEKRSQKKEVKISRNLDKPSRSEKQKTKKDIKKMQSSDSSSGSDSSSNDSDRKYYSSKRKNSDDEEEHRKPKIWGLVKSDGTKIPLNKTKYDKNAEKNKRAIKTETVAVKTSERGKAKKLSEEEKEKLRLEMMKNAAWRDKERTENFRASEKRKKEEEAAAGDYKTDFIHRELQKSANSASVETRIKANLNNIQRSSKHMDSNFSKRH